MEAHGKLFFIFLRVFRKYVIIFDWIWKVLVVVWSVDDFVSVLSLPI